MKRLRVIKPILIILLAAILLECTLFNLKHWATLFNSPRIDMYSREITKSDGTPINAADWPIAGDTIVNISGIDCELRTIYIKLLWDDPYTKALDVLIRYRDENGIYASPEDSIKLINGYKPSYYIPIYSMGRADNLTIELDKYGGIKNADVRIQDIGLNLPYPFVFTWARVALLTLVSCFIYFWKRYKLGGLLFDDNRLWQKRVDFYIVLIHILMLFFMMLFSFFQEWTPDNGQGLSWILYQGHHYDRLTDAIAQGRLDVDIEVDDNLLNAKEPYNPAYREDNGIKSNLDYAYYKGKYYVYFGVVPALLRLPFRLITRNNIAVSITIFIYNALSAIGISFLWKELTKKYLPGITYSMYLIGLVCALFGSNLIVSVVRGASSHEEATISALMFVVWGLCFILKSVRDKAPINRVYLALGASFMALAVGCRPTALFHSLLVPVILFPAYRKRRLDTAALLIPYIIIGTVLMWYNYARFGSITEFGANYQITSMNVTVTTQIGVLGLLRRVYEGLFSFLFASAKSASLFPFFHVSDAAGVFPGQTINGTVIGAFMFPVTWFLPFVLFTRKEIKKDTLPLIITMVADAFIIIVITSVKAVIFARYTIDFLWLIFLSSLLCMCLIYKDSQGYGERAAKTVRYAGYAAAGLSIVMLIAWGMTNEDDNIRLNNPVVVRYISDLLMIF